MSLGASSRVVVAVVVLQGCGASVTAVNADAGVDARTVVDGAAVDVAVVEASIPDVPADARLAPAFLANAIWAGPRTQAFCALATSGGVRCWGGNGALFPAGTVEPVTAPRAFPSLDGATQVSLESHGCARMGDGTAQCWGTNFLGELGNPGSHDLPAPVLGLRGVASVHAASMG